MWNVEERFSPKAIESLAALGFAVGSTRGVVRVEKYGCGAEFRKGPDDLYQMTIPPTIMLKGQFTRLWDAGDRKSTRLNSSHGYISYAVFCLKKKKRDLHQRGPVRAGHWRGGAE